MPAQQIILVTGGIGSSGFQALFLPLHTPHCTFRLSAQGPPPKPGTLAADLASELAGTVTAFACDPDVREFALEQAGAAPAMIRAATAVVHAVEGRAIERFIESCDPHGFARIYSDTRGNNYLLAFPCKTRHSCPNFHQKRMHLYDEWVEEAVLAPVPHRQYVFMVAWRHGHFSAHNELRDPQSLGGRSAGVPPVQRPDAGYCADRGSGSHPRILEHLGLWAPLATERIQPSGHASWPRYADLPLTYHPVLDIA